MSNVSSPYAQYKPKDWERKKTGGQQNLKKEKETYQQLTIPGLKLTKNRKNTTNITPFDDDNNNSA